MTNAEAIETLRANYPDACFEQLRCAVDMAINALTKEAWKEEHPVSPLLQKLATNLQPSKQDADDTISRKAAIDAIMDADVCVTWNGVISDDDAVDIAIKSTKGSVISSIVNMPSAQPDMSEYSDKLWERAYERGKAEAQQRWIPCSERLPEENGQYLITVKYVHVDGYDDIYAEHGEWTDGKWDMFCFGHCGKVENIIAWMPLPEPYAERRTDDGE